MSNYYSKRSAKVNIAHMLMSKGWKVYGYKEDKSDSMTDYYDPAYWEGIATKNGYILVVDNKTGYNSGKDITKYNPAGNLSLDDKEKIAKLEVMTESRGCTAGEEQQAKETIEKIKNKLQGKSAYVVIDKYPEYIGNPGRSIWHIEKDDKIYDKGNSLTKFADIPAWYMFDYEKMQYKKEYKYIYFRGVQEERSHPEDMQKNAIDFKNFIQRLENIAAGVNTMGDGTEETEQEGIEAEQNKGFEKITATEQKTVTKLVKVDRQTIQKDDILSFSYHGHLWQVVDVWQNSKGITCYTYEILGSEKRGYQRLKNAKRYYQPETRIIKDVIEGKVIIHTMQTVTETIEKEKWVKIEQTQKANNSTKETAQQQSASIDQAVFNHEFTVTADTDTRDNSPLWVVKIVDKLSREEYITVSEYFKTLKGYYSKFKHGFIFKYDPTNILQGETMQQQEEETTDTTQEEVDNLEDISTTAITELQLTFRTEAAQKANQAQKQAEEQAILEKINKNIESLQSKIDKLSGDYQTNTYKRMQEQAGRESKINSYDIDIKLLEHVKEKIADNQPITALEKGLTVAAFRDEIHGYYMAMFGRYPREIKFPVYDPQCPADGWYNKELPKRQKKLQRYGINNTKELITAVEEYKQIYDSVRSYINPIQQQIKKLTSEYKLRQKGDINFTPAEVVEEMIRLARIDNNSIVLEPSAGIGNIADKIKEVTENIDVCEQMYSFVELLKMKGYNIAGNDFLEYNRHNYYDAILMNPPFSNNQDITHLKHAYNLLKAGGTLVCITSPHWTFANDRTSQEFRQWIEQQEYFTTDLPSGTFEMTGVRSQIVVIEKQEEAMQQAV